MFATDYLKEIEGPDDWVCVYDFGGTIPLLGHVANLTAHWSPSRKLVAFGNNWHDVPDMPAEEEPTEKAIDEWVTAHPGYLERKIQGELGRKAAQEQRYRDIDAFRDEYGAGQVEVVFRMPDGSVREIGEACGIHGPLFMMRLAVGYMLDKLPPGTVLQKLTVSRKKPAHRGERKLSAPAARVTRRKKATNAA